MIRYVLQVDSKLADRTRFVCEFSVKRSRYIRGFTEESILPN
ncbi:hypothetical protein CKA32_004742 [Geitlerinema sp. FC II]|nr:hypothetical protein CKA32_004742 [Geitlerinema sp. FC II]